MEEFHLPSSGVARTVSGGPLLFFGSKRFECLDFCDYGAASFERVHQLLGGNSYIQGTQEQDEIRGHAWRGRRALLDFFGSLIFAADFVTVE